MSDIPTEKPDPVKDYAAYKRWRDAQKGGGAATATADKPASGESAAKDDSAKSADDGAKEAKADPNAWPPPDRPNPITHYQEYKAWKAKRKGAAVAGPAVSSDGGPPRKKMASHASKFKKKEPARRSVLLSLGGAMWAIQAGALGMFGARCLRFLFPNVLYEPPKTFKIGPPDIYLPNEVDNSLKGAKQIWVVRDETKIFVLKAVCTHLGCTPNWLAGEGKFKCPCHGSGFRFSGMNFEGPAPRPLERFRVFMADDGQIVVDTTKVYLSEAEWGDPEASVPV
jgi:cytochrome b6-f complex iron-sulfur subunit